MIRCPDSVTPERREVRGGEFTIGRGQGNEWVIADPERHLSKRHCRLVYGAGAGDWELHDLSSNGTFLNQSPEPVGQGGCQKVRNGDRIKFGPYELEVIIDEDRDRAVSDRGGALPNHQLSDDAMREPMAPRSERPFNDARWPESRSALDVPNSPILPPDFDPLAPSPEPFAGPTQPDHVPALQGAFRPSPVAVIPDNWDVEPPVSSRPQPLPEAVRALQTPFPREGAVSAPSKQERGPPMDAAGDARLATAFLRGVGLDEAALSDPEKTLERVGAALRATVSGLRQILMARASIKDEFRIEQTMIRASRNNPLKFSLDDDEALATLMGRRGGMAPEDAIAEAFDDLRMHELATVSAMQAAVRVLLAQFDPESVERKVGSNALHIHPAQRKAKAWEIFVQQHRSVTQALSDDFDSVFGKAFARAYEQAIDKLTGDRKSS